MDIEDRIIMSFAGLLILFSIDTRSILKLVDKHPITQSILKANPFQA
jgi:hypothetical protein